MDAPGYCKNAAELMEQRGEERDNHGERSMARCVATFNAMTGHNLSTEDGWLFMVYLKHARMRGGCFQPDDYADAVAYEALMAEEAENEWLGEVGPTDEITQEEWDDAMRKTDPYPPNDLKMSW